MFFWKRVYVSPPLDGTATSISPSSGDIGGGTPVTITGHNFTGSPTVIIGGLPATSIVVVNSTTITCVTASHAAGVTDVLVNGIGAGNNLFTFTAGGSAASVTSVTGPNASAGGGATRVVNGSGFVGIIASDVKFGGTEVLSITSFTSTAITCVVPAYIGPAKTGTAVDVQVCNRTLASGFTYWPAEITRYATVPDDGTRGVLGTNITTGTVAADTAVTRGGHTYSIKCNVTGNFAGSGAALSLPFDGRGNTGTIKNAPSVSNGLYRRFYLNIPTATVTDINGAGHQAKLTLCRVGGTQPPFGLSMLGYGSDFPGGSMVLFDDGSTGGQINVVTGVSFGDGVWVKIGILEYRDTVNHIGYLFVFANDVLVASGSHANVGSDSLTDTYEPWTGGVYTESTGALVFNVDTGFALADGYIE
jgi:hypothetical protein